MTSTAGREKGRTARAVWYTAENTVELRTEELDEPTASEVVVRSLFSAISRGTERLIMGGGVSQSDWDRMRAPLQAGSFPYPVKYGYSATGVIEQGPSALLGRTVFVLHPHQDLFVAPADMAVPLPDGLPPRRATLAANMETALNAVWDSGCGPADRIVVVGGGIVGLLVAYLAGRLPGAEVTLVDVAPERRALAEHLGVRFADPATAPPDADTIFHTSASAPGLATAIGCAGMEATIVELSWYGDGAVPAPLGGSFHSRRLRLISSQVGQISPSRRPRWTYRRRLEAALSMLHDATLDALLTEEFDFADAPTRLPQALAPGAPGLAPSIRYPKTN